MALIGEPTADVKRTEDDEDDEDVNEDDLALIRTPTTDLCKQEPDEEVSEDNMALKRAPTTDLCKQEPDEEASEDNMGLLRAPTTDLCTHENDEEVSEDNMALIRTPTTDLCTYENDEEVSEDNMALIRTPTTDLCTHENDEEVSEDNMGLIRTPTTDLCTQEADEEVNEDNMPLIRAPDLYKQEDEEDDEEEDDEDEHYQSVAVASPRNNKEVIAAYDSICVNDSKEIQVGSKNVYHGQVTINHIVYPGSSEVAVDVDVNAEVCEEIQSENLSASNENLLPDGHKKKRACWKYCCCILWLALICNAVVFGVLFYSGVFDHTDDHPLDDGIRFVTRSEWQGRDALWFPFPLETPVFYVIIAHTGGQGCNDSTSCSKRVREIQDYFMDNLTFVDIGYNFLIGVDGWVYIGRGWQRMGLHTLGYDTTSICIAFIGDFDEQIPTVEQLTALKLLIAKGLKLVKIFGLYSIYSQCQIQNNSSPGKYINEAISNFSHYNKPAGHQFCTFP